MTGWDFRLSMKVSFHVGNTHVSNVCSKCFVISFVISNKNYSYSVPGTHTLCVALYSKESTCPDI